MAGIVKRFLANRVNKVILAIVVLLIIALAIIVPVVDVDYFKKDDPAKKAAVDASRYAVIKSNFADPSLIKVNDTYYAFATRPVNHTSLHIQVATATNLSRWTLHEDYDAMPSRPAWSVQVGDPKVWAPQPVQRANGDFVMYFSALHHNHTRKHCVGAATSTNIMGPYTPLPDPLACQFSRGGAIDPAFIDDPVSNQSYVLFKDDGNTMGSGGACGNSKWPNTATSIQYDIVSSDLTTRIGNDTWTPIHPNSSISASTLITSSRSDGPNVESPQLWYHEYPNPQSNASFKSYHMLYNSGCFSDQSYKIHHIVCWGKDMQAPESTSNNTKISLNLQPDFRTCSWQSFKEDANSLNQTDILLKTGTYQQPDNLPDVHLYAPGGPGVDQEGKYMVFHADIQPAWFDHPRKYHRTRGMFIAELTHDSTKDQGLGWKIILPGID